MIKLLKKKNQYVFCKVEHGKTKELSWSLYQDSDGNNAYEHWQNGKKDSCHYGLKLDKFTNIFNEREERVNKEIDKSILLNIYKNIDEYLKEDIDLYKDIDFNVKVFDKLVIGLGEHSVFETDIKLHHTYGVPYIPASSVKGCFRSHIIEKYLEGKEDNTKDDKNFVEIFGGEYKDKKYSGDVIFVDLFPKNSFEIKKDVMTPHYQNGYTDDGNITPIEFLTVENTYFRFILRISNKCLLQDNNSKIKLKEEQDVRDFIIDELVEMIVTHGIGAKTSVGYGYFEEITKEECLKQTEDNEKRREKEILEETNKEKIKKIEEQKRLEREEEDRKFKEVTKDMSRIQVEFYKINRTKDENIRHNTIMMFYCNKINELERNDQKQLAECMKRYLESIGEWKIKRNKRGEIKEKKYKRVEEICKILNIELPKNNN